MITSLWLKMSDDDGSVPLGPSADSSSVCSDAASEFRMLEKLVDNLKKDIAEQKDQHIEECRTIRIECEDIKEQQNELIEQQRHLMRQLVDVSTTLQNEIINGVTQQRSVAGPLSLLILKGIHRTHTAKKRCRASFPTSSQRDS